MATKYTLKHTGTEIDTLLTKIATAPENMASESFVKTEIANLVNSAPETLDTLGEVATALQENDEVVDALNSAIGNKANTTDVLTKTNTTSFTPTANYHPATKKYVDDKMSSSGFTTIHEHSETGSYEDVSSKTYTANVTLSDGLYLVQASCGGSSGNSAYATASFGINGTYCDSFDNEAEYYISQFFIWLLVSGDSATAYIEDSVSSKKKTLSVSARPTSLSIKATAGSSGKYYYYTYIRHLNVYKIA